MARARLSAPAARPKPVTMQDVARASGVSTMTVSRVLAGNPSVDARMKRRVLDAARELDYVPNALAINFGRNTSAFIGVATPFRDLLGTKFFGEVMAGLQSVVQGTGQDFALFDCRSEAFKCPKELAKIYRQKKAGGLFLISPRMDDRYLNTLADLGVAFIVVGECVNDRKVPSISCNDRQGIELVLAHLFELGHRRIAYVGGQSCELGSARRREEAFRAWMTAAGLPVPGHFLESGNYTVDSGREAAHRLLAGDVGRAPTAIVVANDLMAVGVMAMARDLGLRVPQDLSVTGFDNLLAPESEVSLTTVHQPVATIAATAARMLLDSMESGVLASGHTDVDVSLVVRGSTATAPKIGA